MDVLSSYGFIIQASIIIILSYVFSIISKRTNIPSVLMLIGLGLLIQLEIAYFDMSDIDFFPVLEILGIVGLIMIVLEAALDLELKEESWPIIRKSFFVALISCVASAAIIAMIFMWTIEINLFKALLYAVPLSITSSAIVIPSINKLSGEKKEYLIYESTFSDIFGIMIFYFLLESANAEGIIDLSISIGTNIFLTVAISVLVSYILILIFQEIRTDVRLFLLLALLMFLYSIGKIFHLSSLLIILIFGLILNNPALFFKGRLKKWHKADAFNKIYTDFKLVTIESAFVLRTFFFVIFGITISLSVLLDINVLIISASVLVVLYVIRFVMLRLFIGKSLCPELFISPRGLISILLFFAIPEEFIVAEFESGILLVTIMITSIIMAIALVHNAHGDHKKSEDQRIEKIIRAIDD